VRHLEIETGPASPYEDIQIIEGGGPHANENLARSRLRFGYVVILENVEIAMFVETECLH
jgi:hypothetical protein